MTDGPVTDGIDTPLGEPGSGRLRYAAAMTLYAEGRIPPQVLEAYRIASARDGTDPAVVIRAMGVEAAKPL